jgi:hypothetical protein
MREDQGARSGGKKARKGSADRRGIIFERLKERRNNGDGNLQLTIINCRRNERSINRRYGLRVIAAN